MRVKTDKGTTYVLERDHVLDGFKTPIRMDGPITHVRWGYEWLKLTAPKTIEPGDLLALKNVYEATRA